MSSMHYASIISMATVESWHCGRICHINLCSCEYKLLPKYQPKRGGDLGWGKLFRFICGIKNYLQIVNVDLANVLSQINCNINMIWNQAQVYI